MQLGSGVKAFVATPAGKIALTLLAAVIATFSLIELGALIAIFAFLFFMLLVPIYLGWKRPRELAVCGLAALLVAGPLGSAIYAQQLRTPVGSVGSDPQTGAGGHGSVLTNASVHPFTGTAPGVYRFNTTLNPRYLPANATGPEYVVLYLSTCANATTTNEAICGGTGYPFWTQDKEFPKTPNATSDVAFSQRLNMSNLWFWTMAYVYNESVSTPNGTHNATFFVWLDSQSFYGAVQGPISGDFYSTTVIVLPLIFEQLFLYVALVFFLGLLVYMFLKARRARRDAEAAGPIGPTGPTTPGSPPAANPNERSCPNCGAVIYPSETTCWKCGKPVAAAAPTSPALR